MPPMMGRAALTDAERERKLAELNEEALAVERAECAVIFRAEAEQGALIDLRGDTSPQAALSVRLITAPNRPQPNTGRVDAYDIVGPTLR